MGYSLGIDLGTVFTAAAVARGDRVDIAVLGNRSATIPSLVFLREDDGVLIGDAAERRGLQEPWRLAREFKRRFGDTTPILLDRTPFSAERLMAVLLRQVISDVTAREGGEPDNVCMAHPANWGPFKAELLRQAVQLSGLRDAMYVTEPVAAAVHYASTERVETGDIIAVYDLGGGTFDAAVLRKTATGFETLGQPQGIERLGGVDFDEAVFAHVRNQIDDAVSGLDMEDPLSRSALARLRQECVAAKEALSTDTEANVPVMLPGLQTQVKITRAEFEAMIRPTLRETVETLRRAITMSGVPAEQVRAVLLAGGSSRIPLISRLLQTETGLRVVADAHPKHAVALGAARLAADAIRRATPVAAAPPPPPAAPVAPPPPPAPTPAAAAPLAAAPIVAAALTSVPPGVPPTAPPTAPLPPSAPASGGGNGNKRWLLIAAAIVAVAVIAGAIVFATKGNGSQTKGTTPGSSATSTQTTTPGTSTQTTSGGTSVAVVTDPGKVTTTVLATTTTVPPQTCGASGRCAGITNITVVGQQILVDYQVTGFSPSLAAGAANHHMHFFYNTTPIPNAGVHADGSVNGVWEVWDLNSGKGELRFTAFTLDPTNVAKYKGAGATQICIAVADSGHHIEQDTASCFPLGFTVP